MTDETKALLVFLGAAFFFSGVEEYIIITTAPPITDYSQLLTSMSDELLDAFPALLRWVVFIGTWFIYCQLQYPHTSHKSNQIVHADIDSQLTAVCLDLMEVKRGTKADHMFFAGLTGLVSGIFLYSFFVLNGFSPVRTLLI